jgi:hypothetical protein
MSRGYIDRRRGRERKTVGGPKTGADSSVVPADKDETRCVMGAAGN